MATQQINLYEHNLKALREIYPEYAKVVSSAAANDDYELLKTKTKFPNLHIKSKDMFVYDNNDPIHGTKEMLKWHGGGQNVKLAIIMGFGLGYDAIYYAEQLALPQRTDYILIIEQDPLMVKMAMNILDLVPLMTNKNIRIMIGLTEDQLFTELNCFMIDDGKFQKMRACKLYYNPYLYLHAEEYYTTALRKLIDATAYVTGYFGNCAKDSMIGVENMLANIKTIISTPGLNMLEGKFKGVPAVIVSSGPSLNINKHLLHGLQDKAVIIAADSALKPLLADGIKPHMVTALEREPELKVCFEGLTAEQVDGVSLVACPVVYPNLYESFPGRSIVAYRKFDHFKWLNIERGIYEIKVSAGNMAFKVAEVMGCDPIILIGQDLALSMDGRTNADGINQMTQNNYLIEQRVMLPGNDGQPIESTKSLKLYWEAYEVDVSEYKGKCVNATEGGAKISGTEITTFQDAIDKYLTTQQDIAGAINAEIEKFSPEEDGTAKILRQIDQTISELEEMISHCQSGLDKHAQYKDELESNILEPGDKDRLNDIIEDINQHKKACVKNEYVWQLYCAHICQSFFIHFDMEVQTAFDKYQNTDSARADIFVKHDEWFDVMGGLFRVIHKSLREARDRLCVE